jgi:hypothetical protein
VVARVFGGAVVSGAHAQSNDRGTTLTPDGFSYLVNKDVGAERWSISLNFAFVEIGGQFQRVLSSVTGNVFKSDGSAPSFVYCTERDDSAGDLADLSSIFRFRCLGADACTGTARACAANDWSLIADDVPLQASFFLPATEVPPGGSDDGIEPKAPDDGGSLPGLATTEFSTERDAATLAHLTAASCAVGSPCFVRRLGTCNDVEGRQVLTGSGICQCLIGSIPAECIACEGGTTGTCGGSCAFEVGTHGAQARGACLPHSATAEGCICYPAPRGGEPLVEQCAGLIGAVCAGERCCADDPREDCDPARGDVDCVGVCVDATSCDPGAACGICSSPAPTAPRSLRPPLGRSRRALRQ